MKLINKYNTIEEYYSATMPNQDPQFEHLIFIPYNSKPSTDIEVFSHPTFPGHTFVGFASQNNVSKDDPILEHQYSMTHLNEHNHVVNYKSVLMNNSKPSEIIKTKMEIFEVLNYQHLDTVENKESPKALKM